MKKIDKRSFIFGFIAGIAFVFIVVAVSVIVISFVVYFTPDFDPLATGTEYKPTTNTISDFMCLRDI